MKHAALIAGALALSILTATLASGEQAKQTTGPQEQPGPLGFPGIKHLTEVLMLNSDQANAVHRIYADYQKKEHQAQQEAAKEAQKDKTPGSKPPRADTKGLRDDMVNEIKAVLTEEQRKKLDDLLAEKKGKKKNN